jgi:hypothetical protein
MRGRTLVGALGVALLLAAAAAHAKEKDRVFVGCVEARKGKFELATVSVKGKARNYALVGSHDFSKDVGHRVRVSGTFSKRILTAATVTTVAPNCRL